VINKNIPIVVLTAYADKDAKNETFIAGANYFIAKPFKQADIKRIFEQFK
jgi:CheY-like chemotaxis protein